MKAPVSRRRGRWPTPAPVVMDLLGRGDDGALYLWSKGAKVQPLSRFPRTSRDRIKSGHYVIESGGSAVTVHVGNAIKPGIVVVQWMCSEADSLPFGIGFEKYLLGMVVPDPEAEAELCEMLRRMTAEAVARQTAPHRKRGAA